MGTYPNTDCTNRLIRCAEVVAPYGNICYQLKPVGAGRNNVKTSCATRVCRACVDETACVADQYLTLRTGCERHGRKNPLPFPFSQRSDVGNLRQTLQGKGVIHKRVETAGVYPLVRPRGVSALPAEVQRKTPARQGRTRLRQFVCPGQPVQKKEPPVRGRTR